MKLLKITLETSFYVHVDETNICYSVELSEDVRTTMLVQEFGQAVEEAKQMVGACMNESNKTLIVLEND